MSTTDDDLTDLAREDPEAADELAAGLGLPAADNTVGLALSGGGYRAMLFHLGSLIRLNEAGCLPRITRVASVSGGSITAGQLGLAWSRLTFDESGVATNFEDLVARPILDFAAHTVDVPAVLTGLWPGRISTRVQKAYDKRLLHGATLQDLPEPGDGPLFELLATNLTNGTLWRFSQPRMGDWRTKYVTRPDLPIAHAVAASSAFPPVLSPCFLDIPGRGRITLTDGGAYDNLGIEPILKNCGTILVSDGGGTFTDQAKPHSDWLRGTLRVLNVIDVEVRRLRRRQVMGALAAYHQDPRTLIHADPAGVASGPSTPTPTTRTSSSDRRVWRSPQNGPSNSPGRRPGWPNSTSRPGMRWPTGATPRPTSCCATSPTLRPPPDVGSRTAAEWAD